MAALHAPASLTGSLVGDRQPIRCIPTRASAAGLPARQSGSLRPSSLRRNAGQPFGSHSTARRVAAPHAAQASQAPADATEYCWKLGVGLGVCAFEAYTEDPNEEKAKGSGKLGINRASGHPQVFSNGTEVFYLDSNFLSSRAKGRLELSIKGATDLPSADLLGKSDAYAKFELSGVKLGGLALNQVQGAAGATKIVKNDTHPVWDDTYNLLIWDIKQSLSVTVWDDDAGSKDDLLGTAFLSLEKILDGKVHKVSLDVQTPKGKVQGKVQLVARFHPFGTDSDEVKDATSTFTIKAEGDWNYLLGQVKKGKLPELDSVPEFTPLAFVDNQKTETQALLFWNRKTKSVVVAFRGTEGAEFTDILTDLKLAPKVIKSEDGAGAQKKVWVHTGFYAGYNSVKPQVLGVLDAVLASKGEGEGPWNIFITGHSLGGALSTLCASDVAKRTKLSVTCYNYGSPRVGNKAFADEFNRLVPNTWRVINKEDVVTKVPPLMGYCHVGHAITFTDAGNGDVKPVKERNTSNNVIEGLSMTNLAGEIAESFLEKILGGKAIAATLDAPNKKKDGKDLSNEEVKEMIEKQSRFVKKALDKNDSSVSHHMGSNYADSILTIFNLPKRAKKEAPKTQAPAAAKKEAPAALRKA